MSLGLGNLQFLGHIADAHSVLEHLASLRKRHVLDIPRRPFGSPVPNFELRLERLDRVSHDSAGLLEDDVEPRAFGGLVVGWPNQMYHRIECVLATAGAALGAALALVVLEENCDAFTSQPQRPFLRWCP